MMQSLPRIPPNISHQPCLFRALKVGGLLQQSLPYIGKLSIRKATKRTSPASPVSHVEPHLFRALNIGALPQQSLPQVNSLYIGNPINAKLPREPPSFACFPCEPRLFRTLKIAGFASAKPTTNTSQHEQPCQRKALFESLPASLVSHVKPCFFRALKIGALLKQSLLRCKAYHEYLPTFRTSLIFFAPLNIESFASAKAIMNASPTSLVSHVKPCFFRALRIRGFA